MFGDIVFVHLWPIKAINMTWCQKCFKVKQIHKFTATSIHPTSKGEREKAKHPNLKDTFTQGTLLLSSIPDHKQQQSKSSVEHHIHPLVP